MSADDEKAIAAARAVGLVEGGMVVGLGTGSTAAHAILLIGAKVAEGMRVTGVPTSEASRRLALDAGIPVAGLDEVEAVDLTIDGADEVAPDLALIKGAGGALLREKIVAAASRRFVVIVDSAKLKPRLGGCPLPVEIVPFAHGPVARRLAALGGSPRLRGGDTPFVTDEGHWILDCHFGRIDDPPALAATLDGLAGVVEHGLFLGMATCVIVGRASHADVLEPRAGS